MGTKRLALHVCRVCNTEQKARGWRSERCVACGGLLDRVWVKKFGGPLTLSPNVKPAPPGSRPSR